MFQRSIGIICAWHREMLDVPRLARVQCNNMDRSLSQFNSRGLKEVDRIRENHEKKSKVVTSFRFDKFKFFSRVDSSYNEQIGSEAFHGQVNFCIILVDNRRT